MDQSTQAALGATSVLGFVRGMKGREVVGEHGTRIRRISETTSGSAREGDSKMMSGLFRQIPSSTRSETEEEASEEASAVATSDELFHYFVEKVCKIQVVARC